MRNMKIWRSALLPLHLPLAMLTGLEMAHSFSFSADPPPSPRMEVGRNVIPPKTTTTTKAARRGSSYNYFPHQSSSLLARTDDDDDDDADADEDGDWRAFRAKLVMSEGGAVPIEDGGGSVTDDANDDDMDLDGFGALYSEESVAAGSYLTPLSPSQWAYDSGKVIERGAVILGGVEQDFGFGLRQQYFHKAVILVLDHDENTFTKGIILNRPSDRMMEDDVNEGLKWRVWFGGDVQGLDSILPDIVCLHSLRNKEARDSSFTLMKDIQWTSFENAKKLVRRGIAKGPDDFWLFAGYAGWGSRQLAGELDRKSWYMCATDSQTLLKELARQGRGVDPRDAGLETWTLLMKMIGRGETASKHSHGFDDWMLKEWSQANLVRIDGGDIGLASIDASPLGAEYMMGGSMDKLMMDAARLALSKGIAAGSILRASSADRSPFLLSKQELHHSLILILLEDEKVSLGCMLNHPSSKGCDLGGRSIPIRYGGDFAIKGQSPVMWLHCKEIIFDSGIGSPVGDRSMGIYKCTQEEATVAITRGAANTRDFLVTSGVCVWPKHSLSNDAERGVFEVVEPSRVKEVFDALQRQEVLTKENLEMSLSAGHVAWKKAACREYPSNGTGGSDVSLTQGIGEGFDEEDETVVFNSEKKVSELANDALKKWVATFLLGAPTLV